MTWRNSVKPISKPKVLIQKESTWRQSVRPLVRNGKDFDFKENEAQIYALVVNYINAIKDQLKGQDGKASQGKDGANGSRWFVSKDAPAEEMGQNQDFCLCETGDVYEKEQGSWVKRISLKGAKGDTRYIGGGVTEDRVNQLIAANGSGGGVATNIVRTNSDLTITTETHVVIFGAAPVTISLRAIGTDGVVTLKNSSSADASVLVSGGGDIDDEAEFTMVPGAGYTFFEDGVKYHVSG
jgi:hypothetical protein